jgi:hypothetical protein
MTPAETITREPAKEFTLNASKTFASRYSSLLSIVLAAILGRPEKAADCSRVANADVSRLYEPSPKGLTTTHCHVLGLPEGDVPTVDFETMYRPMPPSRIRVAHRTIGSSSRDHGASGCRSSAGPANSAYPHIRALLESTRNAHPGGARGGPSRDVHLLAGPDFAWCIVKIR